ncbi:GNAT family N-acetyltransferase [Pseudoruegeria sp. SHC-113]|uniref:GNAT family N-acetyltransferase n=1 Tax=Pseudoruegeria sp. SHC-113 TaxID=2855439 RepID=UPI0021BA4149|nr:GNAT family N-acetyltransferase [Pseudoruegeria sp. SHC-113]MCT8161360.1 N-acetyltransferase [Pseudoruegeria sp. SHC-113]
MSEDSIKKEVSGSKGRYLLIRDGHEAELTFSIASPTLVIADHTGVPEELRGTGAGRALFEALIANARADGFKIVPLCPFVNAERRKHPGAADLFAG